MLGLLIFLIIVFAVAAGFSWLAEQPDSLLVIRLGGFEFAEENLAIIAAMGLGVLLVVIFVWMLISLLLKSPGSIGAFFKNRRRERGWRALADGVIAVGSGDVAEAMRLAKNSQKYLPSEPATQLLAAQAAQMKGDSNKARKAFETMLETPETKLLGLRGLYLEAEADGQQEAARHFIHEAFKTQPGVDWAGRALLNMQAAEGDFDAALKTLCQNADAKLFTKREAKRLRAVLLTAHAGALEDGGDPQKAKEKALEAHRLAPDLVPAAVIAARVLARVNDLRKAAKIVETAWKLQPHPDLMAVYTRLRSGDSGLDRLKRAETLDNMRPNHPAGIMGVVKAKMAVKDWVGARKDLQRLLMIQPTRQACLLMADIDEGEFGSRGRMREWLSRAVKAPRDPVWTADGFVADKWAPFSPMTGELDAFEWRVPVEDLGEQEDLHLEQISDAPHERPSSTSYLTPMSVAKDEDPLTEAQTEIKEGKPDQKQQVQIQPSIAQKPEQKTQEAYVAGMPDDAAKRKAPEPAEERTSKRDKAPPATQISKEGAGEGDMKVNNLPPADIGHMAKVEILDPINKPVIDDPGMKVIANKDKTKFTLFRT